MGGFRRAESFERSETAPQNISSFTRRAAQNQSAIWAVHFAKIVAGTPPRATARFSILFMSKRLFHARAPVR